MRRAGLHALGRNAPLARCEVDLVPGGAERLAAPCRGQDEELEAQPRALRDAGHVAHGVEGCADLRPGQCAEVRLDRRHGGQRPVDGFPRHIRPDVTVGLAPLERGADALAELARELRAGAPQRLEDAQDIVLTNRVDAQGADLGEGVLLKRLHPGTGGPGGAPPRPVRLEGRGRRGAEGRRVRPSLLGQRVDAVGDGDAVGHGALARLGEGDGGIAAEADVAAPAGDGDALDPGLGAAGGDSEIEGGAVAVQAGPGDVAHGGGGELAHVLQPNVFPHVMGCDSAGPRSTCQDAVIRYLSGK